MAWTKLDNPKPSASALGPNNVRICARRAMKDTRYIVIKIGEAAARKASFTRPEHRCHLLVGGGEDAGNIAIALDDSGGKFLAKRKPNGTYQISVSAHAALGRFRLTFALFDRPTTMVGGGSGPLFISVPVPGEFLAPLAGSGK